MGNRDVHYESAFEAMLRSRRIPCVSVDEAKRALFADAKLKSFDFVVYPQTKNAPGLLVDVKGRKAWGPRTTYQNWATRADVDDMLQWQQAFGDHFRALFVFVYWIEPPMIPEDDMYEHAGRWYRMLAVELSEYRSAMRLRSEKWDTVCLKTEDFRNLARPFVQWL